MAARTRSTCLVAVAAVLAACGHPPATPAAARDTAPRGGVTAVPSAPEAEPFAVGGSATPAQFAGPPADAPAIGDGAIDTWSGWLPDGRTFSPFDTSPQPIARLNPLLLKAIQDAARAAAAQGVTIVITSGWRSRGFQQRLFVDGIRQYGSQEAASQFVASADVSKHVVGEAVDIGGDGASEWMIRNGPQFGLCQIYANENWHFELATDAAGNCPPLRPNAAG
ncbi:M15 family metallopeptidase [Mycolicibacterium arenosum]|uniref:M15 family metallopeptidase n=1 Tax=Mycolicibacterium arenosum TaxID=2952157 RepID=A0ABT1M3L6_9MYCO|nr:M15 family metallopeptidase [Mycolicibacterium sp. CAU 1645]MCP9273397.1 M15 family metallopeptidase [Mycolicibacterium sp. CAU 1645]